MPKPNLLFIFSDQHRPDTLGCYGDTFTHTPNLDRLASASTVFENAYCTQPVCTPSRSSLLTGLFPHSTGCLQNNIPLDSATPTLAEWVSPEYLRAYVGKWHLGNEAFAQHGFEMWLSLDDKHYATPKGSSKHSAYHNYLVAAGFEPDQPQGPDRIFHRDTEARMPAEHRKARFVGREAARLIGEAAATGRPFVIYASFQEPHPPYVATDDRGYDPAALPLGPTFRQRPPAEAAQLSQWLADAYLCGAGWYGIDMTTEAGWRQTRASYLSNVTLVDEAVGDILGALEASGQADKTVVVFTSDHGDMLGDQAIFGKGVMYEASVRVPLLIRVPWLAHQHRRVSASFSQIDLVPTLLELLGADVPANLPGQSWAGVLAGAQSPARDVVIEWNGTDGRRPSNYLTLQPGAPAWDWDSVIGPGRTLLSPDGYKLNLNTRDRSELYHLPTDPDERANLFDHPGQQARIRDLTGRLRAWQTATGDQLNLEGR